MQRNPVPASRYGSWAENYRNSAPYEWFLEQIRPPQKTLLLEELKTFPETL